MPPSQLSVCTAMAVASVNGRTNTCLVASWVGGRATRVRSRAGAGPHDRARVAAAATSDRACIDVWLRCSCGAAKPYNPRIPPETKAGSGKERVHTEGHRECAERHGAGHWRFARSAGRLRPGPAIVFGGLRVKQPDSSARDPGRLLRYCEPRPWPALELGKLDGRWRDNGRKAICLPSDNET